MIRNDIKKAISFLCFLIIYALQADAGASSSTFHNTFYNENNHFVLHSFRVSTIANSDFKNIINDISPMLILKYTEKINNNNNELEENIDSYIEALSNDTRTITPLFNYKYCKDSIIFSLLSSEFKNVNSLYICLNILLFGTLFDIYIPKYIGLSDDKLFYTSFCICEFLDNFLKSKITISQKSDNNKIFQEESDIAAFIIAHIFNKIVLNETHNKNINHIGNLLSKEFKYLYEFTYFEFNDGYLTEYGNMVIKTMSLLKDIVSPLISYDNSYQSKYLDKKNWESMFKNHGKYDDITIHIEIYMRCFVKVTNPPFLYILNIDEKTKALLQCTFKDTREYRFNSKLYDILLAVCWRLHKIEIKTQIPACIPYEKEKNTNMLMNFQIIVMDLILNIYCNDGIALLNDTEDWEPLREFYDRLCNNPVFNVEYFKLEFDDLYRTINNKDDLLESFHDKYIRLFAEVN
ncbi:hypothetical protein TCON_0601 [Astathelohania contejeani]|uniref:Uncharacterized protein n=1 Tax=Astathelohania contejeani TaxID=164912 RepID=A0ABQ7I157_9MICR|nr:hypothetical protein TCON_0601 [Thelohania contejeani]